jgi:hypothetical protein
VPPSDRRLNITVNGAVNLSPEKMYVDRLLVGPRFFEAMGVPLLAPARSLREPRRRVDPVVALRAE